MKQLLRILSRFTIARLLILAGIVMVVFVAIVRFVDPLFGFNVGSLLHLGLLATMVAVTVILFFRAIRIARSRRLPAYLILAGIVAVMAIFAAIVWFVGVRLFLGFGLPATIVLVTVMLLSQGIRNGRSRRLPTSLILIGIVAVVAAFAAIVWFMDPLLLPGFGLWAFVWIGLPASIVAVTKLRDANGRISRPSLTILCAVAAYVCLVVIAVPTNRYIQERAVADAKAYPALVAPMLEAYKQAHGSYPTSLDQLPAKPRVPRLLRNRYHSDAEHYRFWFPQPGGLISSWEYDSKDQKWNYSS